MFQETLCFNFIIKFVINDQVGSRIIAEESFKKLKTLLTTTPILRIVNPNKDFVVCTDACNDGLGGVLT